MCCTRCTPAAPGIYRRIANKAIPAIKAGDPGADVYFPALASSGAAVIKRGRDNLKPLPFLRALGCVDAKYRPERRSAYCRTGFKPVDGGGIAYHPHSTLRAPDQSDPDRDKAAFADIPRLFAAVDAMLFYVFSIPKSIFLPMFILVMGIGFQQKVAYAAFSTIFIVIMSASAAVESVKTDHVMVARSYGATPLQILTRVYVPSMMPILLETLRIAMIFNFTGVMIAEMYASRTGIGHLIGNWGENFMLRELLAGVILLAAAAIAFNETIRWLEARCSTWRT